MKFQDLKPVWFSPEFDLNLVFLKLQGLAFNENLEWCNAVDINGVLHNIPASMEVTVNFEHEVLMEDVYQVDMTDTKENELPIVVGSSDILEVFSEENIDAFL